MSRSITPLTQHAEDQKRKQKDKERLDRIHATAVALLAHGVFKRTEDAIIKAKALDEEVYGTQTK